MGDAEAITEGRELMGTVCGGYCHATVEGETTDAPDLFDCEWWHGDTDGDLFGVIRTACRTHACRASGASWLTMTSGA